MLSINDERHRRCSPAHIFLRLCFHCQDVTVTLADMAFTYFFSPTGKYPTVPYPTLGYIQYSAPGSCNILNFDFSRGSPKAPSLSCTILKFPVRTVLYKDCEIPGYIFCPFALIGRLIGFTTDHSRPSSRNTAVPSGHAKIR